MKQQQKRKILSLSLVMMLIITLCPVSVKAESEYTYTQTEDGTLAITGYTGSSSALDIPEEIDGQTVTEIASKAFQYNLSIQQVTLPDTITEIGESAFNDCSRLKTINFSQSLTDIEDNAFFSCTRLEDIQLPDHITTLGDGAFYHCSALKDLTIPGSLKDIGDYTFGYCLSLQSVDIQEGVEEIPQQTFFNDSQLTNISLPDSVTEIGMRAFNNCSMLSSIDLPEHLQNIGASAFSATGIQSLVINAVHLDSQALNGLSLDSLIFGPDVKDIDDGALSNAPTSVDSENPYYTATEDGILFTSDGKKLLSCPYQTSDEDITYQVPDGVTEISEGAFRYNNNITEIILPDSITTIKEDAFTNSAIQKINLPDSLTEIVENAFACCQSLTDITIPSGIKKLNAKTFFLCNNLTHVTLNDGLEEIGDQVFSECNSLTDLIIPASVSNVNGSSFYRDISDDSYEDDLPDSEEMEDKYLDDDSNKEVGQLAQNAKIATYSNNNSGLTVQISDDNPYLCVGEDGNIYSKDRTSLSAYIEHTGEDSIHISNTVTTIEANAIVSSIVTKFFIPASVTTIGDSALGSEINFFGEPAPIKDAQIYGQEGSEAQSYAQKNEIAFFTGEPVANAENITLSCGDTFQYQIENAPDGMITYASSDNLIASINQDGTITAKANGTADIYAVNGSYTMQVAVTVQGGSDPVDPYDSYKEFTNSTDYNNWENSYYEYNKDVLKLQNPDSDNLTLDIKDNSNINDYSSNNYIPIKAHLIGGSYTEQSDEIYGKGGYEQFKTVANNMHEEIQRYKLNENLKVYSGTSDISFITGGGSSFSEMIASIGKTVTDPCVISTSLSHEVAAAHGNFTLEIYTPKDLTNGVYVKSISEYPSEYELLLNYGLTYKVIDAGIRTATLSSYPDASEYPAQQTEKYIKLLLNPQPDTPVTPDTPDTPDTPVTPDTPNTPVIPDTPNISDTSKSSGNNTTTPVNASTTTKTTTPSNQSKASKTGDPTDIRLELLLMLMAGSTIVATIIRKKQDEKPTQKG